MTLATLLKDCYLGKKRVGCIVRVIVGHVIYTLAHSRLSVLFPAPPTVVQARIKLLSDKAYKLLTSQLDQADQSSIDFKVLMTVSHDIQNLGLF